MSAQNFNPAPLDPLLAARTEVVRKAIKSARTPFERAAAEDAARKLQIDLINDGCERVATALFKIAHANPQKIGLFR